MNTVMILVYSMVSKKPILHIRLSEEDKQLLKELAKKLDISEADVVKIAIKKLAQEWGLDKTSKEGVKNG